MLLLIEDINNTINKVKKVQKESENLIIIQKG